MEEQNYILVQHFCQQAQLDEDFIASLNDYGLIHFTIKEREAYIDLDAISEIERWSRLHFDLGINLEGLDALRHMLSRMERMEKEMKLLKDRLRLYE